MVVLKNSMLEFNPGTLEYVRKEANLDKEGRIQESVDILEEWVKKQQHFLKKDFSRDYLERTLINAKGLVERAKTKIDKLCTFKTLMPEIIPSTVDMKEFDTLKKYLYHADLPKMTKEYYRVYLVKLTSDDYDSADVVTYYRYIVVLSEYIRRHDYNSGFILIMDFRDINILNFMTKFSPIELRQIVTLMTEGYSMRIKQIHVLTASKMVDTLVVFLKQVLSSKLATRLHLHKNIDKLTDFVSEDVLPEEYRGKEKSLKKINEDWSEALSSPEFVEYYKEMYMAKTDESYRQADKFNQQYVGMPGSFRALSVD